MTPEMRISLSDPSRRLMIAVALLGLTLIYGVAATCQYLAAYYAARPTLKHLIRATMLQPGNAEYQDRLGRFYSLSASLPEALPHFQAAALHDPHQSRYWLDLAAAYAALGDGERQAEALDHALAVDPTTPDIAWEAANLYLVQGQSAKALQEFRIVLANQPERAEEVLPLCLRLQPDTNLLLRDEVPGIPSVYFALIDLFLSQGKDTLAAEVWGKIAALGQSIERPQVFDYVRVLMSRQEVRQALLVWKQAAPLCNLQSYQPSSGNLVVNGDFSLDILNAGFDWRYRKLPGISISLDPSEPHFGTHSLLLRFDGSPVREGGIEQMVALPASATLEFQAYFKAEDMQGAGGVRLTIQDAFNGSIYFSTPPLRDADFWKHMSGQFTTGRDTQMVRIFVERTPMDSAIRGKLWLDAISLREIPSAAESRAGANWVAQ